VTVRLPLLRASATASALLLAPSVPAVSPRTGDLATAFAVGVDAAPGDGEFGSDPVFALSQEFYWTAANAIRGTAGSLDLPGDDAGGVSAFYLTANVSHNWLRRAAFPYLTGGIGLYAVERSAGDGGDRDSLEAGVNGGAGLEVRLASEITLRIEALVHALTGNGPSPVASGSIGLAFYY
jgi:opacity protein-like surface antigen